MRRKKFVFIQHVTQGSAELLGVDDREESPFAISWSTHTGEIGCQVTTVFYKPFEPAFEIGEPLQKFGLQGLNCKERNQADHRTDLHRRAFTIGEMQDVVEKSVFAVPHRVHTVAAMAHSVGNVEEVLPELAGDVFINRTLAGEFKSDGEHVEGVHGHPRSAVGLFNMATSRKRSAAIEDADVVEAEKAALEHVHAFGVLAVHPPSEVEHEFLEHTLKKSAVTFPAGLLLNFVDAPRGPCVNRRIHIT